MKNFKSKLQLLACLSMLLALVSCSDSTINVKKKKQYTARIYFGKTFMDKGYSEIECDSFDMVSTTKAIIYIDGRKSNIITDDVISFSSN